MRISVIIPTYNRAGLLPKTIDSVLAQTRRPDEIIVVDDGSTDDTLNRLHVYRDAVTVIEQVNQGRSAARNHGLARSTGDALVVLDSDDLLLPTSIERHAQFLEAHAEIDVVYSRVLMIDGAGETIGVFGRRRYPSGDVFAQIAQNNFFPPCAYLFRRACLQTVGGFVTAFEPVEDFDFWMRMAAVHKFAYLDVPLSAYRVHGAMSMQTQKDEFPRQAVTVQQQVFTMPAFARLSAQQKAALYCSHGTKNAKIGEMGTARQYYLKALRVAPWYARAYLLLVLDAVLGKRRVRITQR
jgi:hypothetical protein